MLLQAVLLSMAFGAGNGDPATLGIFVDFDHTPSAASVEAMYKELQTLLAPAGIAPSWRQLRRSNGGEEFDRVVIVRFKGVCHANARADATISSPDLFNDSLPLAHTKVVDGRVLPLAEVECDNIKKGMGRTPLKDRQVMFGNILGRVLAHELYHLLQQTVEHQKNGLMKTVVSWNELISMRRDIADNLLRRKNIH